MTKTIEVAGSNAGNLGAMVDTETLKILGEAGNQAIASKNRAPRLVVHMTSTYGEALRNFPKPGSKAKDHASNVLTDFGPWGEDAKTVSWYDVWFAGTPLGKKLYAEKQKHKEGEASAENKATWEAHMAAFTTRISRAVSAVKESKKLFDMLETVNQETDATATITMDGNEVIPSTKCIFIRNEDMTKFKQWSVGQFLRIDLKWASEQKGGLTYDNLIKSTETEPKKPEGFKVSDAKTFDTGVAALLSYMVHIREPEQEKAYKAFLSHLNEAGSDYLILSMDALGQQIENFLELPSIKKRNFNLQEAGGLRELNRKRQANAA